MKRERLFGYILIVVCLLTSLVQACIHNTRIEASDVIIPLGDSANFSAEADCDQGCSFTYEWADPDGGTGTGENYSFTPTVAGEHEVQLVANSDPFDPLCFLPESLLAKAVAVKHIK